MSWVTHDSLAKSTEYLQIDDVIYLPANPDQPEMEDMVFAIKNNTDLANELPDFLKDGSEHHPLAIIEALKSRCGSYLEKTGALPDWVDDLPGAFVRMLNIESAYTGLNLDHFAIVPQDRFARLPYMVLENGLVQETVKAFNLFRLAGIGQLGFLHDAIVDEFGQKSSLGWTYSHTRYHHVLTVMAMMTIMMRNNHIPEKDFNTGRIAALTHDALTPARGDTTKLLDYEAFDEDKHYPEVFWRYDAKAVLQKYRVEEESLTQTVMGNGVLGSLLNYADKLAYIATDLDRYTRNPRRALLEPDPIKILAEQHPYLCTIWDDARVSGDQVYFTDIERLAGFLYTRAIMFREFYWHPNTRFLEFTVGAILLKYLYRTGKINRDMLLSIGDDELDDIISKEMDLPFRPWTANVFGEPRVELFREYEKAKARQCELARQGLIFTVIENLPGKFKVGTHMKVMVDGRIVTLAEAEPAAAKFLESKSTLPYPYRIYYLTDFNAGQKFLDAFTAYQNGRLNSKSA